MEMDYSTRMEFVEWVKFHKSNFQKYMNDVETGASQQMPVVTAADSFLSIRVTHTSKRVLLLWAADAREGDLFFSLHLPHHTPLPA
jgi:hypothetical protein